MLIYRYTTVVCWVIELVINFAVIVFSPQKNPSRILNNSLLDHRIRHPIQSHTGCLIGLKPTWTSKWLTYWCLVRNEGMIPKKTTRNHPSNPHSLPSTSKLNSTKTRTGCWLKNVRCECSLPPFVFCFPFLPIEKSQIPQLKQLSFFPVPVVYPRQLSGYWVYIHYP